MPTKVTATEAAELRVIKAQIREVNDRIAARPVVAGSPNAGLLTLVQQLEATLTPDLRQQLVRPSDKAAFTFLAKATPEDREELDALTAKWNTIVNGAYARNKAAKEAAEAARERQAVRSAMCGSCFCIHRPNQSECD